MYYYILVLNKIETFRSSFENLKSGILKYFFIILTYLSTKKYTYLKLLIYDQSSCQTCNYNTIIDYCANSTNIFIHINNITPIKSFFIKKCNSTD